MPGTLASMTAVTKALGHRGRLRILSILGRGPMSVCQMAAGLKMPVSTMSGLLLELRREGLIREERRGKWVFYHYQDGTRASAIVEGVLALIGTDPQVRRDVAAASRLRGRSPASACAAVGVKPSQKRTK